MPHSTQSYFSSSQSLNLETMNIFHTEAEKNHMHPPKLSDKKRLNQDQVRLLERSFTTNKKLDPELKLKLANQLGVPPRQVAIWYQNKRARWRTQSLELDYNTVQVKLENALAENRRLERDVKQLRAELRQAHEMMFAFSQKAHHVTPLVPWNSTTTTTTSCSDQGGGSFSFSLHHEDVNGDDLQQLLQLDELYACLIGADGSAWS